MLSEYLISAQAVENLRVTKQYCQMCQVTPAVLHDQRQAVGALSLAVQSLPPEFRSQTNLENVIDTCRRCSGQITRSGHLASVATQIAESLGLKI